MQGDAYSALEEYLCRNHDFPDDRRLAKVRDRNTLYEFGHYPDLEVWESKKAELKNLIMHSLGLWPMPEKCDLKPCITDTIEFDDFYVDNVYFQSFPGKYVTGNLYRPKGKKGPFPAILSPHGHWGMGRLTHEEKCDIPLRCANFAKMGYVSLVYDMVGYLDNKMAIHTYGGYEHELWGVGAFGLNIWNGIRCLDFLESLDYVDEQRIGCTGSSSGASQGMILSAIDERIKVSVPVSMVSFHKQAGCVCENSPLLRLDVSSVEFAAMFAPKPMLIISCTGDWTRNTPVAEYPAIRSIYKLYGAEDNVANFHDDYGHNYNKNSRKAAYAWFRKHFDGLDEKTEETEWVEQPVDFGDYEKLRVFKTGRVFDMYFQYEDIRPEDRYILDEWYLPLIKQQKTRFIKRCLESGSNEDKKAVFDALALAIGASKDKGRLKATKKINYIIDDILVERFCIGSEKFGEKIPVAVVSKKEGVEKHKYAVLVHPEGKKGVFADEENRKFIDSLLDKGYSLVLPDLFLTGEYIRPYSSGGRCYMGNTSFTAFNYTDAAFKVSDVIMVCSYLKNVINNEKTDAGEAPEGSIELYGFAGIGAVCLAAVPFIPGVGKAVIDLKGFDKDSDKSYVEQLFIPLFRAAGGLDACIKLSAVDSLEILNMDSRENSEHFNK